MHGATIKKNLFVSTLFLTNTQTSNFMKIRPVGAD